MRRDLDIIPLREFGRIVGMCSPSNSALIGLYISTFFQWKWSMTNRSTIAIRLALSSLYILDGGSRPASSRHEVSTCAVAMIGCYEQTNSRRAWL